MEMIKAEVLTEPVNRKDAEAWNGQRNKKSREELELEVEKQQENIEISGRCRCCERHGRLCLEEENSLMADKARRRFNLDMNRKRELLIQEPNLEEDTQEQGSVQFMNLDEWS